MKKYVCDVCGWVYDPAVGDPENGIEPGTAFEDIPDDWVCPLCGVGKDEFSPVDEYALFRSAQTAYLCKTRPRIYGFLKGPK